ncbi:MAG: response regulator transcription factor [Crocinitomicaceae bacterium]|nr:MAG: response regulator transcription factor [Crocinitomicaceae bacterium]
MKIILADSNELIRIGMRAVLSSEQNLEIVGEATSSEELISLIKNFGSDIVLIDYTSHGFSIDIIPKVLSKFPTVSFVAITPDQSAQTLVNALRSGVKSYVKKDCDVSEIINSVKETARGNKFFCGQILETIQRASIDVEDIDFESFSCEPVLLSERENQIITFIAEGQTNAQIADTLFLSNHTINTHRKNIMSKLGVKNTAGIVMYAVKTNLVSPNKFLFAGE